MIDPKISVIIPIYGVEKYLRQCLDSVLAQTLRELEIILVDDGSKDKCPEIIDDYGKKDERIIVIHKENGGYGSACNVGFDKARGEYIAIVEPDDFIDYDMYEKLYKLAKENDCDVVKSLFVIFQEIPNSEPKKIINKWYTDDKFILQMPNCRFTIFEHPEFLYFHPSIWSCIYRQKFLVENNFLYDTKEAITLLNDIVFEKSFEKLNWILKGSQKFKLLLDKYEYLFENHYASASYEEIGMKNEQKD